MPAGLAHLPPEAVSHSSDHCDFRAFKGRDVTVIGGGASALDAVALLYDSGANVRLVARESRLVFNVPVPQPRWKQWRPTPALGGGWRNRFYETAPMLFRRLPGRVRREIVRSELGPAGGFPIKMRVERCPRLLSHTLRYADYRDNRVHLHLLNAEGQECTLETEHVIAGTGYRVDLRRLTFFARELRSQVRAVNFTPVLSSDFQSSIRGLHFVGMASANTFGPAMRFLIGARYTARVLARHFASRAAYP